MSFLLALVPAVHQAVQATVSASPVPSVTPSVAPAAQAAHAAVATTPSLTDVLNGFATILAPYVVLIGGTLAVFVQAFLNKLPWLQHDVAKIQDLRRKLVAVVLPLVGAYLLSFSTGHNDMGLAPWVFLVGQILFAGFQALKAMGASQAVADAPAAG